MGWENRIVWGEGLFLQTTTPPTAGPLRRPARPQQHSPACGHSPGDLRRLRARQGPAHARQVLPPAPPRESCRTARPSRCLTMTTIPPRSICQRATRNATIYLMLPARQPGAVEAAGPEHTETVAPPRHRRARRRRQQRRLPILRDPAGRQVAATLRHRGRGAGRVRVDRAGPRSSKCGRDRSVVLDESYIPPVLISEASGVLAGFISQVEGLLHHRAEALAGRVSETATRGAAEIADFLMAAAVQSLREADRRTSPRSSRNCIRSGSTAPPSNWPASSPPSLKRASARRSSRPTGTTT